MRLWRFFGGGLLGLLGWLVWVGLVLGVGLGVFLWYLPVIELGEGLRGRVAVLEGEVGRERVLGRRLEGVIRGVESDPLVVERLARERLGYALPGEWVVRFEGGLGD